MFDAGFEPMLRCKALEKRYRDRVALRGVDLTLEKGRITGLIGPNGAGKSTLIKSILGLIRPDAGEVRMPQGVRIGYLPEIAMLPPSAHAFDLIRLALDLRGGNDAPDRLLAAVGLQERDWRKPLRGFSKGMRQRAALAWAMAGEPDLLILDEPMSGLDALGRTRVLELLAAFRKPGNAILICSHIVPDLVRLCDEVHLLVGGAVRRVIPVERHDMQEAEAIERALAAEAADSTGETA